MKKLYTLLLAAAVTLSAAAAAPFHAQKGLAKVSAQEVVKASAQEVVKVNRDKKVLNLEKMGLTKEDLYVADSRAGSLPSFDSYFMQISCEDTLGTSYNAIPCRIYEDTAAGSPGAGFYLMDNFFVGGSHLEVDLVEEEVQVSATEYVTATFLRIPGAGSTIVYTYGTTKYGLWLTGYWADSSTGGEKKLYIFEDDIDFLLLNNGSFVLWYGDNVTGLSMMPSTGGSSLYNLSFGWDMPLCNGVHSYTEITGVNEDGEPTEYEDYTSPIYAEYSEEANALLLGGFAEYGSVMFMDVNTSQSSAVATNQVVATLTANQQSIPAYLSSSFSSIAPVEFTATVENGKTILTNEESAVMVPPVEGLTTNYTWYSILLDNVITLDFEIPGLSNSGIEETVVSDENAPVVYYNLQGVRVENPSNGLYIKRQGNKATKVFVK